jgi:hypothetical protein
MGRPQNIADKGIIAKILIQFGLGSPPPGEPVLRPGDYGCTDVRRGAEVFYSKEKAKVQEVFLRGDGSVSGQPNYPEVNDDKSVSQY